MSAAGIRPATVADAAGFAECVRAAYSRYIERIGKPTGPMLDDYDEVVRVHRAYVLEDGGEIVGAIVLMDKDDGLLLDNVAVLPSRQGGGIGRLSEHAESEARRLGQRHLDLYTHERMTENIAMYARNGIRGDRAPHRARLRSRVHVASGSPRHPAAPRG